MKRIDPLFDKRNSLNLRKAHQSYRGELDVFFDILLAIRRKRGSANVTYVFSKANLCYEGLVVYIKEMGEKSLLTEVRSGRHRLLIITDKGIKYLKEYRKLAQLLTGEVAETKP